MKLYVLSMLLFSQILPSEINKRVSLPLLIPKENFKPAILDCVFNKTDDPSKVVMLRIGKKAMQKDSGIESYELWVTMLSKNEFAYFKFIKDKYLGYFGYKGHIVLVYGDDSANYFFSETKVRKQFDFLSFKPYVIDENHPPIAIEANPFIYNFSEGQFIPRSNGMGFYE